MLRSIQELEQYGIHAIDGNIGRVNDFYFDVETWNIRYLIVNTESFARRKKVVIPATAFKKPNLVSKQFNLTMLKKEIINSQPLVEPPPPPHYYEGVFFDYYGWPFYWGNNTIQGDNIHPTDSLGHHLSYRRSLMQQVDSDPNLVSCREVQQYYLRSIDAELGEIEDFILDDTNWMVRYLAVDINNWWFGKQVLYSPMWGLRIDVDEQKVKILQSKEHIKNSPAWKPTITMDRDYEQLLHDYYKQPPYWLGEFSQADTLSSDVSKNFH